MRQTLFDVKGAGIINHIWIEMPMRQTISLLRIPTV